MTALTGANVLLNETQWKQRRRDALVLLLAVVFTLAGILAFDAIPEERFEVTTASGVEAQLSFTPIPGVERTGEWLDDSKRRIRCHYPKGANEPAYYCAINYYLARGPGNGVDLSSYTSVEIDVAYKGDVPKLRLFARHFDPRFSTVDNLNSTKYNSVFLPTQDLNRPMSVSLKEFTVAEWWRLMFKLPRELAQADLSNVVSVGLDFSYPMTEGVHDLDVQRIAFVRPRLSREAWYLGILSAWLAGTVIYALMQLRSYRAQSRALQKEANRYRTLATTDPLTMALNRHGLEQRWARLQSGATAHPDHALALLVLDIDHFKLINDSRGHDTGDRVLRQLTALIQRQLRSTDWLARWGGEEFVVLLPSVRPGHAAVLAENLRKAIEAHVFEPDAPVPVTVSIGLALRGADERFKGLFKRADEALYRAKGAGRNRVTSAEDGADAADANTP